MNHLPNWYWEVPYKRLQSTIETYKLPNDKPNIKNMRMKKKIVIHKDKNVHKWQGQNTIPDTEGQHYCFTVPKSRMK